MNIYWDTALISYEEYTDFLKSNLTLGFNLDHIDPYSNNTLLDMMLHNDNPVNIAAENFINQSFNFPEDLYISIDDQNYINGSDFSVAVREKKIFINSYQIDIDGNIEINHIISRPLYNYRIFTNQKLAKMKKIFISYSNEDYYFKKELEKHLSTLNKLQLAKSWSCEEMTPGLWENQIKEELSNSDIIIFMLSINFMSSDYILKEEVFKTLLDIKNNSDKKVICVLVRDFSWRHYDRLFDLTGLSKEINIDSENTDQMAVAIGKLPSYQFIPYDVIGTGADSKRYIRAIEEWEFESKAFTKVMDEIIKVL